MNVLAQVPLPSRKQTIAVAGALLLGVTDTVSVPVAVGLALLPLAWRIVREREEAAGPSAAHGRGAARGGAPAASRARGRRADANV